jgi:hypothetical protein
MRAFILAATLVYCASAQQVTLDDSFGDRQRDFQSVANDISAIISELFNGRVPPVNLPIFCHFLRPQPYVPITRLDNWEHPTRIDIYLSTEERYYAQFVFQLAHELGHVMLDPRRSNGVVETLCMALSYVALDRMSQRWKTHPYAPWRPYASRFTYYLQCDQDARLDLFPTDIRVAFIHHRWDKLARYLRKHRSDQEQLSAEEIISDKGRSIQCLGAIVLFNEPAHWDRLHHIAACTTPNPEEDATFRRLPLKGTQCLSPISELLRRIGRDH